ncbi:MAG: GEVED domain-containing protein [Flavobacterium sp.]
MKNYYFSRARWLLSSTFLIIGSFWAQAQYCPAAINYASGVEPISNVSFAGINNPSPAVATPADDYEDFTGISGTVQRGLSYDINVQGNTVGEFSCYIRIFIDWNQSNTFDTGESYDIATPLYDSDGTDGQTVTRSISIPITATLGNTTMRVTKLFNGFSTACATGGYGQAEDYTLIINAEPSCLPPTGVTFVSALSNQATISWTPSTSAAATAYQYYASTTNTAPDASTTGLPATSLTGTTVGSLNPNTLYYVWVRSECGTGTYSPWSSSVSFTTACVSFPAPFLEDMEGAVLPPCWETTSSNTANANGLWKFTGDPEYDNGNTRDPGTFAWVDGSDPSNIANVTLITPAINVATLAVPELVFDYFSNNTGQYPNNIFKVDVYNGTTWTNIYTNNTSLNEWRTISIPLPAYAGMTVKFRFVVDKTAAPSGNAFYNDIALDNVIVHEAPVCIAPTGVNFTNVTKFGATVNWTPSAIAPSNNYDIYFSTDPTAPGPATAANGGTAVTSGVVFTTFASSTKYYIWVRGNCGANGGSAWSPVASFTTLCDYPTIVSVNNGAACGQGAISLSGTPTSGQLYWWSAETGGNFLASGNTYLTPVITATTNYYVAAASVTPNSDVAIGNGTQTSGSAGNSPYYHGYGGNKTQYIIRAAELHAAGVAPGPINSLTYNITSIGTDTFSDFTVSIGATTQTVATTTHIGGLTPVYYNAAQALIEGDNTYIFTTPFNWDGISNIVVQTCYSNVNYGATSSAVAYNTTSFVGATYTYADNQSAEDICGATTGAVGGSGGTYTASVRPNIIFNASTLCSSPRQMVTATISSADAIDANTAQPSICSGGSANLSVTSSNANYTYVWMPGNLTGAAQTVSPTFTTTYTVTATDSGTNCVTTDTVLVTVNALPPAITVTPPAAQSCAGTPAMLTVTGANVNGNATFGNGTTAPGTTEYPNPFSAYYGGTKTQILYTAAELQGQGLVTGSAITSVSFDFFASVANALNELKMRIGSTTNANTTGGFVPLNTLTQVYSGSYTPTAGTTGLVTFTFTAPYVWDGQNIILEIIHNQGNTGNGSGTRTKTTATTFNSVYTLAKDNVTPAGTTAFDALTPATWTTGGTYTATVSMNRPNTVFAHSLNLPVTWSPTTGLYTDAAATVAYTGQAATSVYAMPATAATYTATATNLATCISVDDVLVTPNGPNTPTGNANQTITVSSAADATIEDIVVTETGVIWYATQANAIAGVNPLPAGTQLVVGSVYYGTLSTGSCVPLAVTIDNILGDKGFDLSAFTYYPNPVKDVLNIKYSNEITGVEVFNLLGQKIITKDANATDVVLNMSGIADGTYLVKVRSGESIETIKIVKKH